MYCVKCHIILPGQKKILCKFIDIQMNYEKIV